MNPEDKHGRKIHAGDAVNFVYGGEVHEMKVQRIEPGTAGLFDAHLHGPIEVFVPANLVTLLTGERAHHLPATPGFDDTSEEARRAGSPHPQIQKQQDQIRKEHGSSKPLGGKK